MGEIIEGTRRHYVGADADKDTIPAGGKAFGDSYHANDKGKQYYWNGAAWKTGLGYEYVTRAIAAADFTIANFGVKDAWQADALDLTTVPVPAGAIVVRVMAAIRSGAANKTFGLRANATTKTWNKVEIVSQVANIWTSYVTGEIYVDSNRLVDYFCATNIDSINVIILGWYI